MIGYFYEPQWFLSEVPLVHVTCRRTPPGCDADAAKVACDYQPYDLDKVAAQGSSPTRAVRRSRSSRTSAGPTRTRTRSRWTSPNKMTDDDAAKKWVDAHPDKVNAWLNWLTGSQPEPYAAPDRGPLPRVPRGRDSAFARLDSPLARRRSASLVAITRTRLRSVRTTRLELERGQAADGPAQVVIIGAGIVGASLADELTARGLDRDHGASTRDRCRPPADPPPTRPAWCSRPTAPR